MTPYHSANSSHSSEASVFPLRAAGIDVGSNALRMIAAEFTSASTWKVLAARRVPVRLGSSVFARNGGALLPDVMAAALLALQRFRRRMDALEIGFYRAAATSAVREARNGAEFIERVHVHADVALEMITGEEEARLVWFAVGSRVLLEARRWLLVDVGGGSIEVASAEGDRVLRAESWPMGAVRLLAEVGGAAVPPERFRRRTAEYIDAFVSGTQLELERGGGLVATGGNIEELARLAGVRPDRAGVSQLPVEELRRTIDALALLTPEQRVSEYGLRPDRADVVLPAALLYERIAGLAAADQLLVPNVGLKEGLLLDAMCVASSSAS